VKAFVKKPFWLLSSILWFGVASLASADTVSLIPSEDCTISEKSLDTPLGSDVTIDSGTTGPNEGLKKNRGLLKFDLASSIPSNAVVTSANLTLTLVTSPTSTNLWFTLHKVLQGWTESAATWTNRLSPPAPWSAPGAAPPTDYSSSVTQSNLILGNVVPATFTFASGPAMLSDVQDWVNHPENNFGWILVCELEDILERRVRKFASKERLITNQRPSLEIQFELPPAPLTLTTLPPTNGQFQFQFNAESNKSYTVLYNTDIGTTNWVVLTSVPPSANPTNILISDPLQGDSSRFYRVQTP